MLILFGILDTVECHHVGTVHDPMSFVAKAIEAGHPKDLRRHVDQVLHEMVLDNFHRPPHLLAQKRINFVKHTEIASGCKADRLNMLEHLRKLLVGKQLVLLGKMLTDLCFPDEKLVEDISTGFKLSGWMPDSNLFPRKIRGPALTLEAHSNPLNPSTPKTDTWNEIEHELEQGWIWKDDSGQWDHKAVARRFGIKQGQKTRAIPRKCHVVAWHHGLLLKFCDKRVNDLDLLSGYVLGVVLYACTAKIHAGGSCSSLPVRLDLCSLPVVFVCNALFETPHCLNFPRGPGVGGASSSAQISKQFQIQIGHRSTNETFKEKHSFSYSLRFFGGDLTLMCDLLKALPQFFTSFLSVGHKESI